MYASQGIVDQQASLCQHAAMVRTLLCLALMILPLPALACRLALALGFDVSRSVDARDYRVQMDGIIAALHDREVRDLILRPAQPVALAIYEWAGPREVRVIVDWVMPQGADEIDALILRLLTHERRFGGLTAVGRALEAGFDLLERAPSCDWQTLDLAGDGQSNAGEEPARLYRRRSPDAITVNGLAIGGHESTIRRYFEREVARGPGSFVEYAPTHEAFAAAFLRKLRRELREPMLGALDAAD